MTGSGLRRTGPLAAALVVAACLLAGPQGMAQTAPAQTAPVATAPSPPAQAAPSQTATAAGSGSDAGQATQGLPDYPAWDRDADAAETAISDPDVANETLERIRAEVVARRQEFLAAQNVNAARIATLREQLAALGDPPAEGQTEAPEIAERRTVLSGQLDQLQVPGIAAAEAYRRADGIIGEIDRILRARQADELRQLWPSPLNPANWPSGLKAISDSYARTQAEIVAALGREGVRGTLVSRLPALAFLVVAGLFLMLRGAKIMDRAAAGLRATLTSRWLNVALPFLSFGRMILPIVGLFLLVAAAQHTGLLGPAGRAVVGGLSGVGLMTLIAAWLGAMIFPPDADTPSPVRLPPERRAEGRYLATMLGFITGAEAFRDAIYVSRSGEAAASVLAFPLIVVAGILLVRMGHLLRRHLASVETAGSPLPFQDRMLGVLGGVAIILGYAGPLLAAVGYIPAALAIVYPAAKSLGILAMVFILQRLVEGAHATLTGRGEAHEKALVPVLVGFVLALASVPLLALVWGARTEDLGELWTAFMRGFSIGDTRISPAAFAVLALVFAVGFMVTRLLQAALRLSILPRTRLDQGGRNAIVSGFGYLGIFISGLIAVHAAGINLAGLAIVAGALSLGVGFGLKNIVENFVSGIILLVERPVSEGDWIEVGGLQGTVQSISVRSTRIQTFDRSDVIVPNADLVSGRVTNYTRFNLSGRLIVPVSVAYGSDTRQVERVLREIAEAEPLALVNPAPMVVLMDFGADAINFEVRLILSDVNFSLSVRSEMNHEILRRFREEGIQIPFPQREVWIHSGDAPPRAGLPAAPTRPAPAMRGPMQRGETAPRADDADSDGEADTR